MYFGRMPRLYTQPGLSQRVIGALRHRLERTLNMAPSIAEESRDRSRSRGRHSTREDAGAVPSHPLSVNPAPPEGTGMETSGGAGMVGSDGTPGVGTINIPIAC